MTDLEALKAQISDEADLCRNEGATDIASLLDDTRYTIETQAREIERLREALEREPKAWLIADEETAWVTLFKPNPNDHPWGDVIPLYSAALAGDSHDQ